MTSPPPATQANGQRDPRRWLVLATCIVTAVMVINDQASIGLINPAIRRDLDASAGTVDLMASMTILMIAAFILAGGALGDIYGRRRCMLIGTAGLGAVSVLEALTPSAGLLVGLRAFAGIFEALIYPVGLAVITVTFDRDERPKAIGLYAASLGIAASVGTVVVQALNQEISWRAVFGFTAILSVISIGMLLRFVPESKSAVARRLDVPGVGLCAVGLFLVVLGLSEATGGGFGSPRVLIPVAIGLVVLGGFVWWEARTPEPALPLSLFRSARFSTGILLGMIIAFAQTGSFYHVSIYLQLIERTEPLPAALKLLPLGLAVFVFATLAGRLQARRVELRMLMSGGALVFALAMVGFWLAIKPDLNYAGFALVLVAVGIGFGFVNAPRTNAVVSSAAADLSGPASAANLAFFQLGSALGVAVMGALLTTLGVRDYEARLTDAGLSGEQIDQASSALEQVLESNAGTVASQFGVPVSTLDGLIAAAEDAYTTGLGEVMLITAAILLVGAVVAWFGLKPTAAERQQRAAPPAPPPTPQAAHGR